jgi:hypothetical protein
VPKDIGASTVSLVHDFNDWNPNVNPMKKLKDGGILRNDQAKYRQGISISLPFERHRWENDWEPDKYTPKEYGVENSVVDV